MYLFIYKKTPSKRESFVVAQPAVFRKESNRLLRTKIDFDNLKKSRLYLRT